MNRHDPSDVFKTTAASSVLVDHTLELKGAMMDELVEATDLTRSTVHARPRTLAEYGYVVNVDNRYRFGVKFCHFGDYVRTRKGYYRVIQGIVSWLGSESSMDADLAVGEHNRIVSLYDDLEFANTPRLLIDNSPFHVRTTCPGKATIAEYPETQMREITNRWGLPAMADDSVTTEDELSAELTTVREQGYAENNGEAIEGSWTIGKAVKPPRGEVHRSLNLSGLAYVIDEETRATQAELLKCAAEQSEQGVVELYQTQANEPNGE